MKLLWHKFTLFLTFWDFQHDIFLTVIIAFNSYLSYCSLCYFCKFNAVCFSYYIDDSQATNWTSTSRISPCASEQNEWSWKIFESTFSHETPISFNVWFDLKNMTCLSVTICYICVFSAVSLLYNYYLWHGTINASLATGKRPTSRW